MREGGESYLGLHRCHRTGASGRETEALIAGKLTRAGTAECRVTASLVEAESSRAVGAFCLPMGADPVLCKASLGGEATIRGFCPFLPMCQRGALTQAVHPDLVCVEERRHQRMCLNDGREGFAQASASVCAHPGCFTCLSLMRASFPWRMPSELPEDPESAGRHCWGHCGWVVGLVSPFLLAQGHPLTWSIGRGGLLL